MSIPSDSPPPSYRWRESFDSDMPFSMKHKSLSFCLSPVETFPLPPPATTIVPTIAEEIDNPDLRAAAPPTIPKPNLMTSIRKSLFCEITEKFLTHVSNFLGGYILIPMILTIIAFCHKSWIKIGDDIKIGLNSGCSSSNSSLSCNDYEMPNWFKSCEHLMIAAIVAECLSMILICLSSIKCFFTRTLFSFFSIFFYVAVIVLEIMAISITNNNIKNGLSTTQTSNSSIVFENGDALGITLWSVICLVWPIAILLLVGIIGFLILIGFLLLKLFKFMRKKFFLFKQTAA